jgi:voltage-gated potassium channel
LDIEDISSRGLVQSLLLLLPSYEVTMKRNRGDALIGFLTLADIVVLIAMSTWHLTSAENILIYAFDTLVVALIAFSFCRRMKESQQWKRYIFNNWYEIVGMIPIVVLALAGQTSNDFNAFITLGAMLRVLAIIYVIRLSRSIEDKSRILGSHMVLQIFILFFLALIISSFFFYNAERFSENSEITNMGDALWWTLQTATTSTFGPNVTSAEGRIVGSIIMLVGIGITGAFISTLAAALTRLRSKGTSVEKDPKVILKIRLAKGEITKEVYLDLLKLISQ